MSYLPSSGQISLNDIHVAARQDTGTESSVNDQVIRSLIGSTQGTQISFSDFYPNYYRYIKFVFNSVSSGINELQIRHVNITDNTGSSVSITATAVSAGWSSLGNIESTNGAIASTSFSSGVTSFYLDCGSGTYPYRYEIWSNDSGNPNRIPTSWDVYLSNTTSFPGTPHHSVDVDYYTYADRNDHGWDWRTYSSSSITSIISSNPTLYGDMDGNYYTSSGTGRKILWSSSGTNNSDILSEYYTRFLRVNFGSTWGGNNDPDKDYIDTFTIFT